MDQPQKGWYKIVKNVLIKNKKNTWQMSLYALHQNHQERRTLTTLQDHRTESGKPSGELKISEVPELNRKEEAKATEKKDN